MSAPDLPIFSIVAEGCVDRFCGRPLSQNPYSRTLVPTLWHAWDAGWRQADYFLGLRGQEEAARWLRAAS